MAALKDARVADRMVERLRRQGHAAYQSTATIAGSGTWYRVRIGRYRNRQVAAGLMRQLKGQGLKPIIVAY